MLINIIKIKKNAALTFQGLRHHCHGPRKDNRLFYFYFTYFLFNFVARVFF